MTNRRKPDTDGERYWYRRGASDEVEALKEQMSDSGRQVFSAVRVLAEQGRSGDAMTAWVACVFTADWTLRQRFGLAWRLVRGK